MSTSSQDSPITTPFQPAPRRWRQGLLYLAILLVAAVVGCSILFPRSVTPMDAPTEVFSAERALVHLPIIAAEPHPYGSEAQARVRDYLQGKLVEMGYETEIQKSGRMENVIGRLKGSNSTGAIVVLAHYDSDRDSPGAADNGSGVAVLLEVARVISSGPVLQNDFIVLFDDNEEYGPFGGTKLFIQKHPWMKDVKFAISLDTAIGSAILVNETSPNNGWVVDVLSRVSRPGSWSSASGGGGYDSHPFLEQGLQVLALEANYPYREKHTPLDTVEIVTPGSVQQMGDQALDIVRISGNLDLTNTSGPQSLFFTVPLFGFFHYPESFVIPIIVCASGLYIAVVVMTLRRKTARWAGLGIAFGSLVVTAGLVGVIVSLLANLAPKFMGWRVRDWPEWPEIIPPGSGWLLAGFAVLSFVLYWGVYWLIRRKVTREEVALTGLIPFLLASIALAVALPRASYLPVWPLIIGMTTWILIAVFGRFQHKWHTDVALLGAALPFVLMFFPLLPSVFMSDGMKSIAILAGAWVLILALVFPAVDGLFRLRMRA